ncbi:WecB/TagA/CpsF family glycosyltransferase [Candidatus Gottesmanbacteria bacterium]|nr:WecB/TagA/CpsF family glycosyltransferase [Candidatus Gottesmanbacteria bacterium]
MRRKTGKILGISIDFDTKNTILEEVRKGLRKSSAISYQLSAKPLKPLVIVTPNPEQLVLAHENPWFAQLLNRADVALPDGIGLVAAMRLLVKLSAISYQLSAIERIPGVEFMEDLVGIAAKERVRIGLIGGTEKVAVEVFECLRARWSGLSGWAMEAPEIEIEQSMQNLEFRERDRNKNLEFRSWNVENNNVALAQILHSKFQLLPSDSFDSYIKKLAEIILATQTQMVFVALGAPKQEIFIQALSRQLSAISSQSSAVSDQPVALSIS